MHLDLGTTEGKTYRIELDEEKAKVFYGLRIGDIIDGDVIGLKGYKIKLTGGSDKAGFPMRKDISGTRLVQVLLSKGPGVRKLKKGQRLRKTVRGNTYGEHIEQINAVVVEVKEGAVNLEEVAKKKEE